MMTIDEIEAEAKKKFEWWVLTHFERITSPIKEQ